MVEKEYRYIQFPLCLLKETYTDPVKGIDLILAYGIVNFALKQKFNMHDVVRQLFYDYYRNSETMELWLYRRIQALEDGEMIILDEAGRFVEGKFIFAEPEDIEYVIEQIKSDPEIKEAMILHYQLHQAMNFLNIELWPFDVIIKLYAEAKTIQADFEHKYGPDAMPTCKLSQLIDFKSKPKDIDLLRAYIACRSIIGLKSFATTHKNSIVRRMIGAKTEEALQDLLDENTHPTYALYSKRYYFDKLRNTLCARGFLMFLSKPHSRAIYISVFMPPEKLANIVNERNSRRRTNNLVKRMIVASSELL